ncbi:hypothetical protein AB3M89_09745 [Microbacterium sp. 179-I 3D2 NHS]|uniref:hypothetical protein n=1 Tax=Microbacterium sp. 179-I 3D2 NHS TaxID=3235178 RepID=UPI0039A1E9F1
MWITAAVVGLLAVAGVATYLVVGAPSASAPQSASTDMPIDSGDDKGLSKDPVEAVEAVTTGPLSDDEEAEVARTTSSLDAVLAASDEIAQRGDGSAVGMDAIATGWVLGELEAKAREQYDLGYKQVGEAEVTSVTPIAVDLASDPATITLKVCIDTSGIDVVDSAGNSMKDSLYKPGKPVAHIYGAIFEDDTWKISTHDIPETQDCAAA